eukprot:scaffold1380_cov161-Amphora_coffeaeformis.AAC.1
MSSFDSSKMHEISPSSPFALKRHEHPSSASGESSPTPLLPRPMSSEEQRPLRSAKRLKKGFRRSRSEAERPKKISAAAASFLTPNKREIHPDAVAKTNAKRNNVRRPFGFLRGRSEQQQQHRGRLNTVDEKKESSDIIEHRELRLGGLNPSDAKSDKFEEIVLAKHENDKNTPVFSLPPALSATLDPSTKDHMVSVCDSSISSWTTMNASTRSGYSVLYPFELPSESEDEEESSVSHTVLEKILMSVMQNRCKAKQAQQDGNGNVVDDEEGSISDATLEKIVTALIKARSKTTKPQQEDSKNISVQETKEEDRVEGSSVKKTLENIVMTFMKEHSKAEKPQEEVKNDTTEKSGCENVSVLLSKTKDIETLASSTNQKPSVEETNQDTPFVHSSSPQKSVSNYRGQLQWTMPSSSASVKSVTNKLLASSVKTEKQQQLSGLAAKALQLAARLNGGRKTPMSIPSAVRRDEVKHQDVKTDEKSTNCKTPQTENLQQLRENAVSQEFDMAAGKTPSQTNEQSIISPTEEKDVDYEDEFTSESRTTRKDLASLVAQDTFQEELMTESTKANPGMNRAHSCQSEDREPKHNREKPRYATEGFTDFMTENGCGTMHTIVEETPIVVDDLIQHAFNEIRTVGTCGDGEFRKERREKILSCSRKTDVTDYNLPRVVSIVSQRSSNIKGKAIENIDSKPEVKEITEASTETLLTEAEDDINKEETDTKANIVANSSGEPGNIQIKLDEPSKAIRGDAYNGEEQKEAEEEEDSHAAILE